MLDWALFAALTYAEAQDYAIRNNQHLVVYINCQEKKVDKCLSLPVTEFFGDKGPKIVIGIHRGSYLERHDVGANTDVAGAIQCITTGKCRVNR